MITFKKNNIKSFLSMWARIFFYKLFYFKNKYLINLFKKQEKIGLNKIPVFIISFNRLSYLKKILASLEKYRFTNIYIIDNASTYPPLLNYYKTLSYKIFYLDKNLGHMVFWKDDRFLKFRNNFYIVTDPDLELISNCPNDLIQKMFNTLKRYPFVKKVGVSLKVDDLPSKGFFYKEVNDWEKRYNKIKIAKDNIYYAAVDTTFALYLPDCLSSEMSFYRAFRIGYPYQARHLPWYKTEEEITEEDKYYSEHKTNGWWDVGKGKLTPD